MKKFTIILAAILLLAAPVFGSYGRRAYLINIVNSTGEANVDVTSFEVKIAGSTTATIYDSRNTTSSATNPIVTGLDDGSVTFYYAGATCDVTLSDGTYSKSWSGVTPKTTQLMFDSMLYTAMSSTTMLDAESLTMGTSSDWVINAGTTAALITFTPGADGSVFRVGLADGTKSSDLQWYTASGVGLLISESANTLGITGLTTSINASSNYNTNINTGTSTGAVTIGSATSGAWAIDGTSTGTINADDSLAVTVSAGTVGISSTGGDLTIDATDKSVIIRGTEEAADAITIDADGTAGGVIISCGTGDITLDSGDDIFLAADTGTGDVISLINTQGTSTSSMIMQSVAGGINIDAELEVAINVAAAASNLVLGSTLGSVYITGEENAVNAVLITSDGSTTSGMILNTITGTGDESILLDSDVGGITINANAGSIDIEAVGAEAGDIGINAGDDMTITAAGDLTFAVTGTTTLPNNQLRRAVVEVGAEEADNLAATQKELVASPGASAYLEFVSAVFALDYGTTAWTEPSAPDDLVIRYTDGSGAIVSELLDATGFATATGDVVVALNPVSDIQAGTTAKLAVAKAGCVNQALVLDNTGSEWTNSGDSVIQVIVYYRIHTLTELGL